MDILLMIFRLLVTLVMIFATPVAGTDVEVETFSSVFRAE